MPDIYQYADYRAFLRDYFAEGDYRLRDGKDKTTERTCAGNCKIFGMTVDNLVGTKDINPQKSKDTGRRHGNSRTAC